MPPKKPFKLDGKELKLGGENIPTLEESLKHGIFVRESRRGNKGRKDDDRKRGHRCAQMGPLAPLRVVAKLVNDELKNHCR